MKRSRIRHFTAMAKPTFTLDKEDAKIVLNWAEHYKFTFLSEEENKLVDELKKYVREY